MRHIYMIGDSTMRFNNYLRYPQLGWGQLLNMFVESDVIVRDYAENGRSTKSFIDEGRFSFILDLLTADDLVICQFGHNDEKDDEARHTDPYTTYVDNLAYFAKEVEKRNANILFATSITRHKFINGVCINSHGEYPEAMLRFCKKTKHICVDLNELTLNHYNKIGEEASKKYHMIFGANIYPNYPNGLDDHSHLVFEGALMVCKLFVSELNKIDTPINNFFINLKNEEKIDKKMLID